MSNDEKILDTLEAMRRELAAMRAANSPKVTLEQACVLLECGRTTAFDLLKSGALVRAPSLGKDTMVTTESVQRLQRDGLPQLPRKRPALRVTAENEPTDDDLDALVK